jgi:ribose 1,5-bisphosphokinase
MHPSPMQSRLIYLMGSSGSGKDSLLRYARDRLAGNPGVVFAHRYITRPHDAGGENHVALTDAEFATRQHSRLFALAWTSHGHSYGVGIEIDQWLGKGHTVVVNGSREYLAQARLRYPELLAVTVEVPAGLLRQRLLERGREDASAIEQRLARHRLFQGLPHAGQVITNDGPLSRAGDLLVACVLEHAGRPQHA